MQKSETKGGCWRVCVMNVDTEVQRQQPLVQYPNAVIHPHNWIYLNAPLKQRCRPSHFPSRFKNVMSQCFSDFLEQFQP